MGVTTVISVIKQLKGSDITIIESKDGDIHTIHTENEIIHCPKNVASMVSNPTIRKAFEELIKKPLQHDGTSSFCTKKSRDCAENDLCIDEKSAHSFTGLSVKEYTEEDTQEVRVEFTVANIKSKSGWKVKVLGNEIPVTMEDEAFRKRLLNMREPHIFGRTFNVGLKKITIDKLGVKSDKFCITEVLS